MRRGLISATDPVNRPALATGAPAVDLYRTTPVEVERAHLTSIRGGAHVVRVVRSVEEVESLRADWVSLVGDCVHTDPDYFLWSLREEPHVLRPHILAIEREGRVEGIVVARIADAPLPCKLGHSTVYAPTVRALCVLREGWLGRADAYTAEVVLDELLAALDRREADVVLFRQLEQGSVLHRAALARSTFATRRQHAARTDVRWQIELQPTLEEYLASVSSSTRKGVRRTSSRLERELGDRLSVRVFSDTPDLDVFLDDIEAVAGRTYQRRLGVGYVGDDRQRTRLKLLAAHGWLRGYVLYLDGQPIAFELGELYGGRFHSVAGAYDPDHAHERVGAYLLLEAIEELGSRHVSLLDFGFGDAEYKGKLAHRRSEEGDLVIYARRVRPIWIKFVRTALLEISVAVTTGLARLALLERIKHWSRRSGGVGESAGPTA